MIKRILNYNIIIIFSFTLTNFVYAEIYKCKSSDGVINFTATPCGEKSSGIKRPKKKVKELNEDGSVKSKKQIIAERIKREKEFLDATKRQRKDEEIKKAKLDKHNNKIRQNCNKAKKALKNYQRSSYLYTKDKKGEKNILSDAERKKAEFETQREITYWCRDQN